MKIERNRKGQFLKGAPSCRRGIRLSNKTKNKIRKARAKQIIPREVYVKNGLKNRGENHFRFKGEKGGYRTKHIWVETRMGKPDKCESCGKKGLVGHRIHWANRDHRYRRRLRDWMRLCPKCHKAYDKIFN